MSCPWLQLLLHQGLAMHTTTITTTMLLLFVVASTVPLGTSMYVIHPISSSAVKRSSPMIRNNVPSSTLSLYKAYSSIDASTFVTSTTLLRWQREVSTQQQQHTTAPTLLPHNSHARRKSWLQMGKGDGKKKRKKKSTSSTESSASLPTTTTTTPQQAHPPAPRRVTSNSIVPVRHQLLWAKMSKESAKQSSPGFRQVRIQRTSYKRTWTEEEMEVKKEERARKGQEPDWAVILNQTSSRPLVIVDGYNIIFKWPRLAKHMRSGDMGRARQLLVDDLETLAQLKGWRIEVVFDGAGRSRQGVLGAGPGPNKPTAEDRSLKKDVSKYGVRVVYTGVGIEADAYIESRCADAKSVTSGEFSRSFIVATDDAMIRVAGISAGALCMSAGRFVDELKAVKKAVEYRVEVAVAKANGHSVRHEKLRGTMPSFSRSVLVVDKRNKTQYIYSAYGGGIKIIEDRKKPKMENTSSVVLEDVPVEPKEKREIPIWARVPNRTRSTF